MGVPSRIPFIKDMLKMLPERTTITLDKDLIGCWNNAKRAWSRYDKNSKYHIVLQDDLKIPPNFETIVNNVLEAAPNRIISLYTPRWAKKRKDSNWCIRNGIYGNAVLMPSSLIPEFLNWVFIHCVEKPLHGFNSYDWRLSLWMYFTELYSYNPFPCLVQHLGGEVSTLFGKMKNKNSIVYPDNPEDLLSVDWSFGLDTPSKYTYKYKELDFYLLKPEYRPQKDT